MMYVWKKTKDERRGDGQEKRKDEGCEKDDENQVLTVNHCTH